MIPSSGCPPWRPDHPRTLPRTGNPTPLPGARSSAPMRTVQAPGRADEPSPCPPKRLRRSAYARPVGPGALLGLESAQISLRARCLRSAPNSADCLHSSGADPGKQIKRRVPVSATQTNLRAYPGSSRTFSETSARLIADLPTLVRRVTYLSGASMRRAAYSSAPNCLRNNAEWPSKPRPKLLHLQRNLPPHITHIYFYG